MTAQVIDDVLAATFPASDPPAWTAGIARPAPDVPVRPVERTPAPNDANGVRTDVTEDFRDKLEEEYAFVCGILEGAGKAPGSENLS